MKTIVDLTEELKEYSLEKDTAAKQAVEANIAPVEADTSSASRAYVVGEQLFLNDVLYDVTSPISVGDAIVVNTNITAANKLSADIQTLKNKVTDISEVMGKNGAKNKEPFDIDVVKALNTTGTWTGNSYALNGITFAFADDGKVTVSGTASALCSINISGNYDLNGDYIITGCPSGGGSSTYSLRIYDSSATVVADDIGEGISFTANNLANCRTNIIVRKDAAFSTPIVFAPMIRDSKDPDATYQPYAKTNQELTAENQTLTSAFANNVNVNGCKNILPNYVTPFSSGGAHVAIDDDGIITVTASSALTGNCNIYPVGNSDIKENKKLYLPKGTYIGCGCPSGGSGSTYYVHFYNQSSSANLGYDYGEGVEFTLDSDTWIVVRASIRSGYTISDSVVFKPMITLSTDVPSDYAHYVPFAKTNRQLTQDSVTWDDYSELGAVNLLSNTATTQTVNAVTFTVNDDKSITFSGTASNNAYLTIGAFTLPAGTYKLSGAEGGTQFKVDIQLIVGGNLLASDYGNGATFTLESSTRITARIRVENGYAITDSLTFYPMIAPVSYNGGYVPPAKTNKELTDVVTRLDRDAVKIVAGGIVNANSSRSFTCTNYEGYRLSIYSIGGNNIGMIVLFGKHPSVSDVRFSIFNCEDRYPDAPQISVSGSTLTITSTSFNCYYVIERILGT